MILPYFDWSLKYVDQFYAKQFYTFLLTNNLHLFLLTCKTEKLSTGKLPKYEFS